MLLFMILYMSFSHLVSLIYTSSILKCILATDPQVLLPAYIQASLSHARHIMDFYIDCSLDLWVYFLFQELFAGWTENLQREVTQQLIHRWQYCGLLPQM